MAHENVSLTIRVPTFPQPQLLEPAGLTGVDAFMFGSFRMASLSEQYRHYAAECLRVAQETHDQALKVRLLEMAEAWKALADETSRRGKN